MKRKGKPNYQDPKCVVREAENDRDKLLL